MGNATRHESSGLTVGVVFGGRSAEHKVSVVSARTVARALADAGHRVVPLGIAQDGCWVDVEAARRALGLSNEPSVDLLSPVGEPIAASLRHVLDDLESLDAVFPIVHGTWGEDGALQGLFEMLDLPYVGADVAASAVCMDKILCKQVLAAHEVPVVDAEIVDGRASADERAAVLERCRRLGLPVFVKPSVGGSSVGVAKVAAWDDLAAAVDDALRFDDRVLIEQAVVGRELECSVLGGVGDQPLEASGIGEIVPGADFYDYADKYIDDGAELLHRADLEPEQEALLRRRAVDAFRAVGGEGMARVDFLLDDTEAYVNEINTLPGFTSISMYPKLWQVAGLEPPQLVDRLVRIAVDRATIRRRLDEGIKSWIAALDG